MSVFTNEIRPQAMALSLLVAQTVRDYFKDEEHQREFEDWYLARYGEPYTWKKVLP